MSMECPECADDDTKVLETRTRDNGIVRRTYQCQHCRHKFNTLELPPKALNCPSLQGSVRRFERLHEARERVRIKDDEMAEMKRMRAAGYSCAEIAKEVGRTLYSVRFHTRIPREKLYPSVALRKMKEGRA